MDKLRRKYGFMPCAKYLMPNTNDRRPNGFTLVEVLIVVAVLGILAAVVIPLYEDNTQKAKESAAKEDLRVLRNAIELYAAQHDGVPPGYINDNTTFVPNSNNFVRGLTFGRRYLVEIPTNPFNGLTKTKVLADTESFPSQATDTANYAWIYQPVTKKIKLNWSGKDSVGTVYFDY